MLRCASTCCTAFGADPFSCLLSAAPDAGRASSAVAAPTADCCCGCWCCCCQLGECWSHHPSCICVGAQMVKTLKQVQLLFQTLTVPSADADATSTDAEYSPWLADRPSRLLGRGGVLPSAAVLPGVAKGGSGLLVGTASMVLPVVGPALLSPRASRCTTSSLWPSKVRRHTKSRSRSHTLHSTAHHTQLVRHGAQQLTAADTNILYQHNVRSCSGRNCALCCGRSTHATYLMVLSLDPLSSTLPTASNVRTLPLWPLSTRTKDRSMAFHTRTVVSPPADTRMRTTSCAWAYTHHWVAMNDACSCPASRCSILVACFGICIIALQCACCKDMYQERLALPALQTYGPHCTRSFTGPTWPTLGSV